MADAPLPAAGLRVVIVALVVLVPGAVAPIDGTAQASEATRIDACTTITESGRYVLASDVRNGTPTDPRTGLGACIDVRADDVVLDGAGHTVAAESGGRPGVVGVLVRPRTRARGALRSGGLVGARARPANVTVRNLTTTRWGAGVAVVGAANATLLGVSAVENLGDGFFVENAPGATIRGGVVRASNTAVFVRNAPDARVENVTVTENLAGVSVRRSDGATVRDVNTTRNRGYGVGLFASANVTVADATVARNAFAGVALASADARLRNLSIRPGSTPGGGDPIGVYLNDSRVRLAGVRIADAPGWAVYDAGGSTTVGERVRFGRTHLSFEAQGVALDSADGVPRLPVSDRQVVGDPLFAASTGDDARLSLSVLYDDAAVERGGTTEASLSLWRFDAGEGWHRTETALDPDGNAATAMLGNPSQNGTVVALVGERLAKPGNETNG